MKHRLILLAALALAADNPLCAEEWFISPAGHDAAAGTLEKPFATLERARDAVRESRRAGRAQAAGTTIWLRAGDYPRTVALELTDADSGAVDEPVVWRAFGNDKVRLIGGRTVAGFGPVDDPDVSGRLPANARASVRQVDLRALGLDAFGELSRRGYALQAPGHCELFYDGRPMPLARWPNDGDWAHIAGIPAGAGKADGHGGIIGSLAEGFTLDDERPFTWKETTDVWAHGYWAWDWANSYERIESLDPTRRLIKTVAPHGHFGFRAGQRLFFLNVLEELDQPGEWFLDRTRGVLYFWPPDGAGPDCSVTLSLLDQPLVSLEGASHVKFEGMIFEGTRVDAVVIEGGAGNRIQGCIIRNAGNRGVTITGGTNHGVVDCDIFDTGDGGVSLTGGDRQTLTPGGHFVENCHFQRQGRWSKCYVPAVYLHGVGLRAAHNLIHDHPHAAVIFWGNDHLIEFNESHHIAFETGDVGAIYTGRDYTFRGNKVRHNFIHHTGSHGTGSMGVYMDDFASGTEIYGNVFYRVRRAVYVGGGRDHQVVNNVFVECGPAVEIGGRGLSAAPVWRSFLQGAMRNALAAVPANLYRERYPALKSLDVFYGPPGGPGIYGDAFKGVPPEGNVVAQNVCVGDWLVVGGLADAGMVTERGNHVGPDPGFVALETMDFRLRTDAPVLEAGFEQIPFEKIGLQPSERRQRYTYQLSKPTGLAAATPITN